MFRKVWIIVSAHILFFSFLPESVWAATATYHLHKEASTTTGLDQLKTAGPDAAAIALQADLTNKPVAEYLAQAFDTQSGIPNSGGIIASGTTVSFTLWMRKTANVSTMYPRAKLYLNGTSGTLLCTATGTTALTTTLTKYSLSCATSTAITMFTSDRFYLWTGVNLTATSATTVAAVVQIEGTLNGNYDSLVKAPLPNAPAITTLSPTSGGEGASVTINGSNFGATQGSSVVMFSGTTATPSSWTATKIIAPVPVGATTGSVTVTVGGKVSNGGTFTVAPKITNLNPILGPIGTSVTITGLNFGATQGTSTVKFNGTTAAPTSWSSTSITVPVPTGATTGPVVVTVGSLSSSGVTFTVGSIAPQISTVAPNSGPVGTSVTISGSNFGATQGTSTMTFNGTLATPTSWSASSIVVPVPTGATTGPVVVTVGGSASNGVTFTVTPQISSLSPTSGPIGTAVTISGSSFGATQGTSTVTFNGVSTAPTSWSDASIVVSVPAGATTGSVVVTVGGHDSNGMMFSVVPQINSISPTTGFVGTPVIINGSGFGAIQGTSTVTFNGISTTPTSWSSTYIVAPIPATATTGSVVVNVGGNASNGIAIQVIPATPVGGRISSDTTWTLSGSPYVATSSLEVWGATSTPITLTIDPGVIVKFQSGTYIQIGASGYPASLSADGTSQLPIIITSFKDDTAGGDTNGDGSVTSPAPGDWQYIYLRDGSSASLFDFVDVRYGGGANGNLYIVDASPVIQNSIIQKSNNTGIYVETQTTMSAPSILNNQILENITYGIRTISPNSLIPVGGTISGNNIANSGQYGIYFEGAISASVQANVVGKGVYFTSNDGAPTFSGNEIKDLGIVTVQVPMDIIEMLQTQNTLRGIGPTTTLNIIGDTLTGTTTLGTHWKNFNIISRDIIIAGSPPAILTVNPGVIMKFADSLSIRVGDTEKGILVTRGTSSDPILLTNLNPPSKWRGISFNNAVLGASILEHVIVEEAGSIDAGINAQGTAVTMNHCVIRNNSNNGIQLKSSDLMMSYCQVYGNSAKGLHVQTPMASEDDSRVTIRNSDIYENNTGGIQNDQSTFSIDVHNTWWGDASGPSGNGPGTGNAVSAMVLYDPWLATTYTYPFAITEAFSSAASFRQGSGVTNLTAELTQNASWTLQISDSSNTVLKTASGSGLLINAPWDGTNTLGASLPDGIYSFRIDATAGTGAAPIMGRVQLSNGLPIAKITDPVPDKLILTPTVNVTGTASASSFSSYIVDVGLGQSPFQFTTVATSSSPVTNGTLGTWTVQSNPPSGYYQIRLRVTGPVGTTAETTRLVRIDHKAPAAPQLQQPTSPTAMQPIVVTGFAEHDSTVELFRNDQSLGQVTAGSDGSFNFNNVILGLGSNTLYARATDAASNVGSFSDKKVVVYQPSGESLIHILSPANGSTVYK